MEKSSKRGKIPQQDWPSIIARYEAGETLASIARTYDCSPPAISYIVSRTRARNAAAEAVAEAAARNVPAGVEHQLLKGPSGEMPANNIPADEQPHDRSADDTGPLGSPVTEPRIVERRAGPVQPNGREQYPGESPQAATPVANRPPSEANGGLSRHGYGQRGNTGPASLGQTPRAAGAGGVPQNGEQRRTLHLSLSQGNGSQANGGPDSGDSPPRNSPNTANPGPQASHPDRAAPRPAGDQQAFGQPARQGPTGHPPSMAGSNIPPPSVAPPGNPFPVRPAPIHPAGESQRGKNGGAFIDQVLRERVDGDIAAFLAAFDAALESDTVETRTELREATDRLLRAGARTRIELERLEARAPLPARDKIGQTAQPLFRQR